MHLSSLFLFTALASILCVHGKGRILKKSQLEIKWEKQELSSSWSDENKGRCKKGWKKQRAEFRSNMNRWENPKCYDFVFENNGYVAPESRGPFKVSVRNGKVADVERVGPLPEGSFSLDLPPYIPTMNQMLKEVYTSCIAGCPKKRGAFKCSVRYDKNLGNIAGMYIDYVKNIADEEIRYRITDFKSCGNYQQEMSQLEKKWEKQLERQPPTFWSEENEGRCKQGWKKQRAQFRSSMSKWENPKCYNFVFENNGYVAPEHWGPFNVSVRNGEVANVERVGPLPEGSFSSELPDYIPTVNQMLKEVYTHCLFGCPEKRGAFQCSISYNEQHGYIASAYIDYVKNIADEELSYKFTDFKPCNQ